MILGRRLDILVLAESVETQEKLAFLKEESYSGTQGYLPGRPCPIEQYADIVGRVTAQQQQSRAAKNKS
jgi:EAL domain-containing protein (putative c-di-GMP-specific phosphodiesterase class I)